MRTTSQFLILVVTTTIFTIPGFAKDVTLLPEELSQPLIGRSLPELAGIDKLYVGIAVNKEYVGVTPGIDDPQKNGLAWKELETKVMNKLLESGIKVVGNIKTVITVGLNISEFSEFRVEIEMLKLNGSQQYVYHIRTCLSRNVLMQHQPGLGLKADVWKSDPVMQVTPIQDMPAEVTKAALAQVDEFIADYRVANPPGAKSVNAKKETTAIPPVVTPRQTTPVVKPTTAEYKYVASKNSKVFHKSDCRWAQRIKPTNLVTFSTREQAIQAGKRPCKQCEP